MIHPASLAFSFPAEPYRRRACNGLAQVIAQSAKEAGQIVLRSEGDGLEASELRIVSGK